MPRRLSFAEFGARNPSPEPWSEGEKIPWNDPAFSARMLEEHLTQDHDLASRRFSIIDSQVEVLLSLLGIDRANILDLGCGPGLYCQRLAAMGHQCTGIDFSPASIEYARQKAMSANLKIDYFLGDIRLTPYPEGQELALFLFGEFNVFRPEESLAIATKACRSLKPGGIFVIEPSTYDSIYSQGCGRSFWRAMPHGLFSSKPHIWMYEASWDNATKTATDRHFILEEGSNEVVEYASSAQAYTSNEFESLLTDAGFEEIKITSWTDIGIAYEAPHFHVIVARKPN